MDIETAYRKNSKELMKYPNVTGVGLGEKNEKQVIIVFVKNKIPESDLQPEEIIPKSINGFDTDVQTEIKVGKTE